MTPPMSPPPNEALESLRTELAKHLSTLPETRILGAQLGTLLNKALAPNSYKSWLGEGNQNLRTFAEVFLQGIISPTHERQGLDHLFQIEGNAQQIHQSFGGALWKAFCSSRPTDTIFFGPAQNTLFLVPVGSDSPADAQLLPGITEQELKAMSLDFVRELESEGNPQQTLVDIAQEYEPRKYSVWVASLKAESGLYKRWGIFRTQWIKDLFAQRVQVLTDDQATQLRLKSDFDADCKSRREKGGGPVSAASPSASAPVVIRNAGVAARQVLIRALEGLDDAQLAKILVPMDVVAALVAQLKQ